MSWRVVGIEGSPAAESILAWGAAAISDGQIVRNSLTGVEMHHHELIRAAEEGALFLLSRPISIPAAHQEDQLVAVMFNRTAGVDAVFAARQDAVTGLIASNKQPPWHVYLFTDQRALDEYAQLVRTRVLGNYFEGPAKSSQILRAALTLLPSDPWLNACRVPLSTNRAIAVKVARSSVRPGLDQRLFDAVVSALDRTASQYKLEYKGGQAESGGYDIDVADVAISNMVRIESKLIPIICKEQPFLPRTAFPHSRLHQFEAASAHFTFAVDIPGETLRDRVARFLLLFYLQETLRGQRPDLLRDLKLTESVRNLVEPDEGAMLTQSLVTEPGVEEAVELPATLVDRPSERSEAMTLVGFISGLQKETRVEITIDPEQRLMVSVTDDGDEETPGGVDILDGTGSFLRKPCIFKLQREVMRGNETFLLRSLRLLEPGDDVVIDSLPSAIVRGSFLTNLRRQARLDTDGVLTIGNDRYVRTLDGDRAGANSWISKYAEDGLRMEIGASIDGIWLEPPIRPALRPLPLALIALANNSGSMSVIDTLKWIRSTFRVAFRGTSIVGQAGREPWLLVLNGETLQLTDDGLSYARVFAKAVFPGRFEI